MEEEGETHKNVIMSLNAEENNYDHDTAVAATATATAPAPAPAPAPVVDDDNDNDNDNDSFTTPFHMAAGEEEEGTERILIEEKEETGEEDYKKKNNLELLKAKNDDDANDSYDDDDIKIGRNSNSNHSVSLTSSVIVLNPTTVNNNNISPLTRSSSTSYGIRPKPLPLMLSRSASEVGAFAIHNPFSADNGTETTLSHVQSSLSSSVSGSCGVDTNITTLTSLSPISRTATTTSVATGLSTNTNTNDDDNIYGSQHHVTEAVLVDVDRVVIASIIDNNNDNDNDNVNNTNNEKESDCTIDDNDNDNNEDKSKKEKTRYIIIGSIIIAVVVAIILLVVFLGGSDDDVDVEKAIHKQRILDILSPITDINTPDKVDAYNWLIDKDVLSHKLLLSNTDDDYDDNIDDNYVEQKIRQRYVLALLYFATNGQDWIQQYRFLTPELDECDWTYTKSVPEKNFYHPGEFSIEGVICNQERNVTRLRLWRNSMIGTLPPEIGHFSDSLIELNIPGGSITGTIPLSFEKLTKLEILGLNHLCLSGTIPTFLSTLPKLDTLSLAGNDELTGSLQEFCNGTEYKEGKNFVSANCDADTFCPEFDKEYIYQPKVECECCFCCNPDTSICCDPNSGMKTKYFKGPMEKTNIPNGMPKVSDRPCLSGKK